MKIDARYILTIIAAMLASAGCEDRHSLSHDTGTGTMSVLLEVKDNSAGQADAEVNEVKGYRFEDGMLKEILVPELSGDRWKFIPESMTGTMYVAANLSGAGSLDDVREGKTSIAEFLALEASADEMKSNGVGMTGTAALGGESAAPGKITVVRSLARLDISSHVKDVEVLKVSVSGFSVTGRIFQQEEGDFGYGDAGSVSGAEFDFSDSPLENTRETLLYLPEQSGREILVEATVRTGNAVSILRTTITAPVLRNNIYNVSVQGSGASISLAVTDGDWVHGGASGSSPVVSGMVDTDNSVLPSGVSVNSSKDTVRVTYLGAEFRLAILAGQGSEVTVDGNIEGVDIRMDGTGTSPEGDAAIFEVTGKHRLPGESEERIHLDIHEGNLHTGRVVMIFEANPVGLGGMLTLDKDGICDFGRYVEGEIGTVSLPEGKTLRMEFPEGESSWMKAEPAGDGDGNWRILAGWRPNDPAADGRMQEGYLVISGTDGQDEESYSIRRRNWGLPVVRMGDTWWTLYNLRGDATAFEDQVTCGSEPVQGDGLFDALMEMSASDLLGIMGDQYQAGYTEGLPLAYEGSAFLYKGMKTSARDFGSVSPETMAPAGYRIPEYGDYAFFTGSDNFNLGGAGERTFRNRDNETLNVRIGEREVDFLGQHYGTVSFYEFAHEGAKWVLYGLGHQWEPIPGNIAVPYLIMATSGTAGRSWELKGPPTSGASDRNMFSFAYHNSTKTRMIRCIKTPVEYMY